MLVGPLLPTAAALVRGLVLLALCAAMPRAQDLDALKRSTDEWRRGLAHDEARKAWEAFAATEPTDPQRSAEAAARLAELALETQALARAGGQATLAPLSPEERIARLAQAELSAGERVAAARWLYLVGATQAAESALAQARDADPALKGTTDLLLAQARAEPLPEGGYHRYRGRFLPLAVRDRARRIDDALDALAKLGVEGAAPPVAPSPETSALEAFVALGAAGPAGLLAAATTLRAALRPDYDEVRGWLSSYARSAGTRDRILAAHAALAVPRQELRGLIAQYDKPEQPEVDRRRASLESAFATYEAECARDRALLERVTPDAAFALLVRVRERERALTRIDECLRAETGTGLDAPRFDRPPGAATGEKRLLVGRAQSGLEDVLWLLAHVRAEQARDALDRAADLLRLRAELTPWEAWLADELQAEAIGQFNERVATSLDATELEFVAILNRYRRVLGLAPFELEERLTAGARKHSREMVDLGYFGHVSPVARNRTPSDRVRLEGYGGGVGENCLAGTVDGRGAFEAWYHSPGHHRGLVSGGPHLGVGAANGHSMWTMVMGGTDLGWRSLHADLPPRRRAECVARAQDFARALRVAEPPKPLERKRIDETRAALRALAPEVLPETARIAFAAATDARHPFHPCTPTLLAELIEADLPVTWRPLQIACIAAAIDLLIDGADPTLRGKALALVRPHVDQVFGYEPDALEVPRREATLKLRAHWEDVAQWRFRRSGAVPEPMARPGRTDGPSATAKLKVLAKPERLRLAKQHGGGTDTERAIDRALEFLARTQDEDGAWRARAFLLRDPRFDPRTAGQGNAEWDIAMTGLAILAFVTSGHTTEQGDWQSVVQKGVRWLGSKVTDYGRFETVSGHYMYGHAIATQALCEVYAYTADPWVGAVAQLAVDYLIFAQEPGGGGWRYEPRQAGDTSVVGWVIMALNAAHKGGLSVVGFRDALRFIDSVTLPGYYQVGYTERPGLGGENLRLTSVGMVCRLFLGQSPEDPRVKLPAWRLVQRLPDPAHPDFYYWYYASIALFQIGGEHWQKWNAALKPALLGSQETERASPLCGSWPLDHSYGGTGGRIYQTAVGVLLLTTYYRYDRAPKIKVQPFTGNLDEVVAPYLARLRAATDDEDRQLTLRTLVDEIGPSLVPIAVKVAGDPKEAKPVRQLLAAALVSVASQRHAPLILPLLGADDAAVAASAAHALCEAGAEQNTGALIAALANPHHAVRAFAARSLGRLGVSEAVSALGARLGVEGDGWVRAELEAALRAIATRSVLSELVDAALPAGSEGRLAAFEGLALLEPEGLPARIAALRVSALPVWEACVAAVRAHRGGAIVPVLVALLEVEDLELRERAIRLLVAVTGQHHGFDAKAQPTDRKKAILRWKDWWKQSSDGFAGK